MPTSGRLEQASQHLREPSTWMRIVYMALFVFAYGIAEFMLTGIVVVQVVLRLFTGSINTRLQQFSRGMVRYVYDILRYLTFNSEQKPFPFSDWKSGEVAD